MSERTMDVLKAAMAEAIANSDDAKLAELVREYNARKAEVAKALAAAAEAEAKALAGEREKLATKLHVYVAKYPELIAALGAVKATGFTFKLDEPDGVSYKSVALSVPTVKAKRTSGGGGGTHTTSKAEYGMTLDEIFQAHATAEDKAKLEAATTNSAKWQVKNGVKKAAIAEGKLQPAK